MYTPSLKPITKPIHTYDLIALDSEGSGRAGDFIIAVLYGSQGAEIFYNRSQLQRHLFRRENTTKLIIAANLEYDYAVCFQPFTSEYEITLVNRKWMRAVKRDGNGHAWTAFDIQRIAPMSVRQMGEVIGLPKLDTPPSLVDDKNYKPAEWKCAAHRKLWCVECYCVRDAEITYKFGVMFQAGLNSLGGEMKMTTASCAMDLFRRRFLDREIEATQPERNTLARQSYYGGRVEAFRIGTSQNINAYDFNSLYPSVMRDCEVGDPASYRRVDRVRDPYRYLDYFGQFFGSLRLPSGFVGVLPFRQDGRLYFPVGDVSGSWTLQEVRYALSKGAHITDCKSIIFARSTFPLFSSFVDTLYKMRLDYKAEGRADQIVVKLMMNSLYGKFAQHFETGLQKLITPPAKYRLETYAQDEPIEIAGREAFLRESQVNLQSSHIHVLWASEITSLARIKLHKALEGNDAKIVYCDTDSIHTSGKFPTTSALGGLKLEYKLERATYFAPKEYGGITTDGEVVQRAKGIPPAYRSQYLREGFALFKQPTHTMTAILKGGRIAEWVEVEKHRRSEAMNRKHDKLPDFNKARVTTYPFDTTDLD